MKKLNFEMEKKPSVNKMKYYKDDCHHYKVIDRHRAVKVTLLGEYESSIYYNSYGEGEHYLMDYIRDKTVTPCTEAEYQTAFDKAELIINYESNIQI